MRKTKTGIIGSGPSGLLLSRILHLNGIDNIVLERQSRDYVLSRIRAGVLEWGSVEILRNAGVGERMDREGLPHDGVWLSRSGEKFRVDLKGLTGRPVMVYGQTEITKDLMDAQEREGSVIEYQAADVTITGTDTSSPRLHYTKDGEKHEIECDFVIGCDGFHGVSRQSIPQSELVTYEKQYPFGWLGVLSRTPPVSEELIYSTSERGFALCSMRSANLSRYYVQCSLDDDISEWPDDRFWEELKLRIGPETSRDLVTGPSIEKSIAPLRSFVCETMRYGSLFLAGDAAHIVPPTGAKGLNLAISDVDLLSRAIIGYYRTGDETDLKTYPANALRRIWRAERFSWWMSTLLHEFPDQPDFDKRIRAAEFDYYVNSEAGLRTIAENYVGLAV